MIATQYKITFPYGATDGYYYGRDGIIGNYHHGVDFGCPRGSRVDAIVGGKVLYSGFAGTAGKMVVIATSAGHVWRYLHNDKLMVKEGDNVKRGQYIAQSGNTGESTAPHLHIDRRINGKWVDPTAIVLKYNKDRAFMEKKFIIDTYYKISGRKPSQKEINFHMKKSTPRTFVEGFTAGAIRWKVLEKQISDLKKKLKQKPKKETIIKEVEKIKVVEKPFTVKEALQLLVQTIRESWNARG